MWLGSALGPEDLHVMYDASDALGEVRPLPKLLITSFKMASRNHQFGALSRRQWASVVVDEAHTKLRAAETDSDETACLLELLSNIPFRLLLTGTPCTSRLADMYHLLSLVRPGLLGASKGDFRHSFFSSASGGHVCRYPSQLERVLHAFAMLRRTKAQVAAELPPRNELVVRVGVRRRHADALHGQLAERQQPPDAAQASSSGVLAAATYGEPRAWIRRRPTPRRTPSLWRASAPRRTARACSRRSLCTSLVPGSGSGSRRCAPPPMRRRGAAIRRRGSFSCSRTTFA